MPFTLLQVSSVAERCYLIEALYWLAFRHFPLALYSPNGVDERQDRENLEGLDPHLPWDMTISDEECRLVGIQADPRYEELITGDFHQEPDRIRDLLARLKNLPKEELATLEKQLEESIPFYERVSLFEAELEIYLDLYKSQLFVSLREGTVTASGLMLPDSTIERSRAQLEDSGWSDWEKQDWQAIPPSAWRSFAIHWEESWLEASPRAFSHVLIERESLFGAFPVPSGEQVEGVVKVGDSYVLRSSEKPPLSGSTRRGRPPFEWDAFHVEVARRIHQRQVPRKREAFVAEMQAWCKAAWEKDVGRSTVLQKLRLYDDVLKALSEKPS